ncbi:MAG: HlyD family efflux transporter periplasmic adaptor subunit [Verrucomicrobiae bacterium]|nr:HlyD family efflux transporter periplasmic adaptor subunit [Verrucomicrobiae bacterium]
MSKQKNRNSLLCRLLGTLKWLIPLAIIVVLAIVAMQPKPIEVDAGSVIRGTMRFTVDDDGEARVRERYRLSAPLAGRMHRITLKPGDFVKKGDVLVTLDPGAPDLLDPRARAQAEATMHASTAAVTSARTQLEARSVEAEQLKKAFDRSQVLHEKGNIADAAFEESESAYLAASHARDAAASAVEIAQFELEQANAALLRFDAVPEEAAPGDAWGFSIRAPIDGVILRVEDESERTVQAGVALLELGDPQQLEMRIDVLSQDAVAIKPGQAVLVQHWGGANPLEGRVRRVEPSAYTKVSALGVDEQRVDVLADFVALPGEGETLADGYRIEARIVVWEKADALQVPAGALFRQGDDWAVYKFESDRARLTLLKIGRNNGEVAEVLDGLQEGDRVILHPGDRISDNTLIMPRK